MISDVKLWHYFCLLKVTNMVLTLESFRKQCQSIKKKHTVRQKLPFDDVLKNLTIFTGKNMCWCFFLIKFQVWMPKISLRRDSNTADFLSNLWNFKNTLFTEHHRWQSERFNALHRKPPFFLVFKDIFWSLNCNMDGFCQKCLWKSCFTTILSQSRGRR